MGKDAIFLYAIAAVAVCFAFVNALLLLLKRGKTAQTIGTISSIKNAQRGDGEGPQFKVG